MWDTILSRRNLAIIIVALLLALAFLLFRPEDASAQFSNLDADSALTIERLLILGMMGLVALTWLYLKWRPPLDQEDDSPVDPEREV